MTEAREKSVLPFRLPVCGPSPRLLSRVEAARYVGISPTSFDSMVEAGTMPRPRRALPTCRKVFDKVELDAAIDALPHDGEDAAEISDANSWADYR